MYGSESSHKQMNQEGREKISRALRGKKQSKEHVANRVSVLVGRKRTPEQKLKMSLARLNLKIRLTPEEIARRTETRRQNGWLKNPEKTKELMSLNNARANLGRKFSNEVNKKKGSPKEKNPAWKGGVTPAHELIRKSSEYKLWREAVFKRDDYTCQICFKRGGRLNADHIKPFALFPELRLAIDNGRTLCAECHRKTETWGSVRVKNK